MAKQKIKQSKLEVVGDSSPEASKWAGRKLHLIILAVLSILLYANTITHDYTQDDAIVITDNEFTTQGFAGIPSLLKYDTFRGFFKVDGKEKLVSGGRYRPLTPVMFAVEWQLFGSRPLMGHVFNLLWFALLVVVLYLTLERLFLKHDTSSHWRYMIFAACILFVVHPIHTEAVANIKGRDEIICLLGSLASLYYAIRWYDERHSKYMMFSGILFFLALMSKENTITFLAVIPLALYTFRKASIASSFKSILPALVGTVAFLLIRSAVIGWDMGGTPMELMNNPFLKWSNGGYVALSKMESLPTMLYCLGKYLGLLVIPHPLTHDYYPRHIDIMSWGDFSVILSTVIYFAMGIYAILNIKKRSVLSFCIIYFLATISIVSNIVFPIGTNMSERFLFMPSVGFSLFIAYLGWKAYGKYPTLIKGVFAVAVVAMIGKTVTRNMVWKDNYTLFTTDVHTSTRSAKILNAAGGTKSNRASKMEDGPAKTKLLVEAIDHTTKALEVHPNYKNAMLIQGNSYFYNKEFEKAAASYERILSLYPGDADGESNLAVALRDAGKYYGEQKQDLVNAEKYLRRSISIRPNDVETNRLLGVANGIKGNHLEAIKYFKKVADLQPNNASAYVNLYNAYSAYGDNEEARINYEKAIRINPEAFTK